MAQNITLLGASYSDVPAVTLPKTGGGTATFTDVTDTTAAASDVASGKYFYTDAGVRTEGTASGGGSTAPPVVRFIDYDGTILHEYSATELASLSALPSNPTHTGLVSQGWNWTLAEIRAQVTALPDICVYVGQSYITESGATEIYCTFEDGALSPCLLMNVTGTAYIDWGDNQTSTVTATGADTATQHTYASSGDYCISITAESGSEYRLGGNSSSKTVLSDTTMSGTESRRYRAAIKHVRCASDTICYSYAFYESYQLQTVTVGLASISTYEMFDSCYNLKSLTLPHGVTVVSTYAFRRCYSMQYVSIPPTVTRFGDSAFYESGLLDITIPTSVTRMDQNALRETSISYLHLPSTVTTVGTYVASGNYKLKEAILNTVYTTATISNCRAFDVTIPAGRQRIGSYEFSANRFKSITLPNTVTYIDTYAFNECNRMTHINIPSSVNTIKGNAFRSCVALEDITFPSGITTIDSNVLYACYGLVNVVLPSTVTTIAGNAFYQCYSLPNITIPAAVTSIAGGAFSSCYGLTEIHLKPTTPPTLGSATVFTGVPSTCVFYVPSASLNDYKTAQYWSSFASQMVGE